MTVQRVLVVGAGGFGIEHVRAWAEIDGAEVVSVVDLIPERAATLAATVRAASYGDVDSALAGTPVDLATVAVPARHRAPALRALADAGVPVLVEKPLASTSADVPATTAGTRPAKLYTAHILRFTTPYRALAQLVASGAVGRVQGGMLERRRSARHATSFPDEDVLSLTMVHDLEALHWLGAACPEVVEASIPAPGRMLSCESLLRDADAEWRVRAEWSGPAHRERDVARVIGDRGTATLTVDHWGGVLAWPGGAQRFEAASVEYARALRVELAAFARTARGPGEGPFSLDHAMRAVALADRIRDVVRVRPADEMASA
jgi:predicted dehydrogenase